MKDEIIMARIDWKEIGIDVEGIPLYTDVACTFLGCGLVGIKNYFPDGSSTVMLPEMEYSERYPPQSETDVLVFPGGHLEIALPQNKNSTLRFPEGYLKKDKRR